MSKDDSEFVNSALDHLEILESHLNHPDGMNQILFDAACMRLSAAIEVLSKTSPEFRELTFGDQWHEM